MKTFSLFIQKNDTMREVKVLFLLAFWQIFAYFIDVLLLTNLVVISCSLNTFYFNRAFPQHHPFLFFSKHYPTTYPEIKYYIVWLHCSSFIYLPLINNGDCFQLTTIYSAVTEKTWCYYSERLKSRVDSSNLFCSNIFKMCNSYYIKGLNANMRALPIDYIWKSWSLMSFYSSK